MKYIWWILKEIWDKFRRNTRNIFTLLDICRTCVKKSCRKLRVIGILKKEKFLKKCKRKFPRYLNHICKKDEKNLRLLRFFGRISHNCKIGHFWLIYMVSLETPISIWCKNVRMLITLLDTRRLLCPDWIYPATDIFHVLKTLNALSEKLDFCSCDYSSGEATYRKYAGKVK